MEWYVNMIRPDKRISAGRWGLPLGMGVARVTVKERIERAKMACRETENFMVGSTLLIVGY